MTTNYRISTAAQLLGISDDTVRRWIAQGALPATRDESGFQTIAGADLAQHAQRLAQDPSTDPPIQFSSQRNRFEGLVTAIISDPVMSQVEMQCGRYRIISLISTEAVRELGLEVGSRATAAVKATNVSVEVPR